MSDTTDLRASRSFGRGRLGACVAFLALLCAGLPAFAATFTVSNLDDTGTGSLRQAITDANADALNEPHTIDLTGVSGVINILTSLPDPQCDMTFQGPGAANLKLLKTGAAKFGIFTTFSSNIDLVLRDLTISGGARVQGAGIFSAGPLTVERCVISDNHATGTDTFDPSNFDPENTPFPPDDGTGGGIYASSELTIIESTISGNSATGGSDTFGGFYGAHGCGGGIYAEGPVTITDSTISGNTAAGGSSIQSQGGGGYGGGIYLLSSLSTNHVMIQGNSATGGNATGGTTNEFGGDAEGGGIYSYEDMSLLNSTISGNNATAGHGLTTSKVGSTRGGGIYSTYGEGAPTVTITGCTLTGNQAIGDVSATQGGRADSGAAYLAYANTTIRQTVIASNTVTTSSESYTSASALYLGTATARIETSLIVKNTTVGDPNYVGAIFCEYGELELFNSTISDNFGTGTGGGLFATPGSATVQNCILTGNTPVQIHLEYTDFAEATTGAVEYCLVQGGFTGTGNIDADPMFRDASTNNYELLPGSPAIDAADGDVAPTTDLLDNPRADDPQTTNTGNGSVIADMGAYEFQPGTVYSQDIDLYLGWNLISLPFVPVNPSITGNFGEGAVAYRWNAAIQDYEAITTITAGEGFYVYSFDSREVTMTLYSLNAPTPFSRDLQLRWNLVGKAFTGPIDASTSIIIVYAYNAQTGQYERAAVLNNGKHWLYSGLGYFIFTYPGLSIEM